MEQDRREKVSVLEELTVGWYIHHRCNDLIPQCCEHVMGWVFLSFFLHEFQTNLSVINPTTSDKRPFVDT